MTALRGARQYLPGLKSRGHLRSHETGCEIICSFLKGRQRRWMMPSGLAQIVAVGRRPVLYFE